MTPPTPFSRAVLPVVLAVAALGLLGATPVTPASPAPPARAAESADAPKTESSTAPAPVQPFAELPSCRAQSGLDLLGDFFGLDAQRRSGALAQVAAMIEGQVDFLIVTVPEPSLGFDGAVEAVTRALEATGHTLDRYFLPWEVVLGGGGKSPAMSSRMPQCPQRYPGVALYQHPPGGPSDPRRLLFVYFVGESPIAGIHKAAFLTAAQEIVELKALVPPARCGGPGLPCNELRIVGPAFSGAVASLEQLLDRLLETQPETPVKLLSGRATNAGVQALIERHGTQARAVSLQATVIPDEALQTEFFCYLTETLGADEHDIAIVTESSTAYGQAVIAANETQTTTTAEQPAHPQVLPERASRALVSARCGEAHHPRLVLPVPLSISRLHSAWEKAPRPSAPAKDSQLDSLVGSGSIALPRSIDDAARTDVIPTLSERAVTAADRALANILTTISAEKIRYVGLVATDVQDKLFLAEQVRKYCPDVVLFTFESDILYTHPDVRPFLRGMMVVSPYPLFTRNQQWSYPYRGWQHRLQFARDIDEGVFNATVAMLGRPDKLLEYSQAAPGVGAPTTRPAIWISAVGIDTLFPLQFIADYTDHGYVYRNTQVGQGGYLYSPYQQGTLSVMLMALGLCGALFVIGYFMAYYGKGGLGPLRFPLWLFAVFQQRRFRGSAFGDRVGQKEHRRQPFYVLLLFLPASLLYFFLTTIHFVQLRDGNDAMNGFGQIGDERASFWLRFWHHSSHIGVYENLTWRVLAIGMASATFELLFVLASLDAASQALFPGLRARLQDLLVRGWAHVVGWRRYAVRTALAVVLFLCAFFLFHTFVVLVNRLQFDFNILLFLRRAAHPAFGLSPTVPMWLLCAGLQLWGYYNLKRMQLLERLTQVYPPMLDDFAILGVCHPVTVPGSAAPADAAAGAAPAAPADAPRRADSRPLLPDATSLRSEIEAMAHQLESPPPWRILIALSLSVGLMVTILSELVSLESYPLNFLFRGLFALLMMCVSYAFYRFMRLWLHFRSFLALLGHHPMSEAFDRMPPKFARSLGMLLLEELPELTRVEAEQRHFHLLRNHLQQLGLSPGPSEADPPELRALFRAYPELRADFLELLALPDDAMAAASHKVMHILGRFWSARPLPGARTEGQPGTAPWVEQALRGVPPTRNTAEHYLQILPDALHLWLRLAEDFIAIQVVSYINRMFPLLRNALFYMTAGGLLLLAAGVTYPFQPAHFLMMLIWFVIIGTVPLTVIVFVQMNRDEVLSRVARSEPGQVTWDRRFISQVVLYGALPLLSLVAAQFPEVRGAAFSWLESILKTLK